MYTYEISENKAELKEQLRIHKGCSRRNNIRIDGIEEDENETWENTENKQDLFRMTNQKSLMNFIQREHTVLEEKIINNTPRTIVAKFLDYNEKEEVM